MSEEYTKEIEDVEKDNTPEVEIKDVVQEFVMDTGIPFAVNYNIFGLEPVSGEFNISPDMMLVYIREIASKAIGDIIDVTYQFDKKSETPYWFIWFNSNSKHFYESGTENGALGSKLPRLSPEFRAFASKFGYNETEEDIHGNPKVHLGQVLRDNINRDAGNRMKGLQIALTPFLFAIFDIRGNCYYKTYNKNAQKCVLHREWVIDRGPNGEAKSLAGISIKKILKTSLRSRDSRPIAKINGSF